MDALSHALNQLTIGFITGSIIARPLAGLHDAFGIVEDEEAASLRSLLGSTLEASASADRWLRLLVVTPDMHRVHHSIDDDETNSNFGFNLPWWDRLFGTYRAQPAAGHEGMTIGLDQFREPAKLTLWHILLLPFQGRTGAYPLGRRAADE